VPGAGPTPILFFAIIGDPAPDSTRMPQAYAIGAGPNYFRTMGIRLLRGRGILPTDDSRAPRVAVVDELLAQRYFAGRDPIGQRFVFGSTPIGADTLTIVGIVASVKQGGLVADDLPEMYGPMAQSDEPLASIVVHTTGDPAAIGETIRRVVASVDPSVPVSDIRTMNAYMGQSIGTTRFATVLASLFALVALALGVIGIYSVLASVVSQRHQEIAVRIALGGSHGRVMRDVLRQAALLAGIGITLGWLVAWMLTHALAGLFLGVSPHDPAIFVGAAATFAAVALAAASVPTFRTTRVNPVVALTST
jgi:putative ABC transport system permease protein